MRCFGSMPWSLCLRSPSHEVHSLGRVALASHWQCWRGLPVRRRSAHWCASSGQPRLSPTKACRRFRAVHTAASALLSNRPIHAKNAWHSSVSCLRQSRLCGRLLECSGAERSTGLTKNTNAIFQVRVPASFATRLHGHSGGVRRCVPSAG